MYDTCCNNAYLIALLQQNQQLLNAILNLPTVNLSALDDLRHMQAYLNPMTIAGEYPDVQTDRFVVSTPVRFLDMLNTDLYVIFKIDNNNHNLPVYFKDSVGYEHAVVLVNNVPVLANQLLLNGLYKAKYQYQGGYIILDSLVPLNPNMINTDIATIKLKKNVRNKQYNNDISKQ